MEDGGGAAAGPCTGMKKQPGVCVFGTEIRTYHRCASGSFGLLTAKPLETACLPPSQACQDDASAHARCGAAEGRPEHVRDADHL